eukprot:5679347-Prymnesium_polylepis.1
MLRPNRSCHRPARPFLNQAAPAAPTWTERALSLAAVDQPCTAQHDSAPCPLFGPTARPQTAPAPRSSEPAPDARAARVATDDATLRRVLQQLPTAVLPHVPKPLRYCDLLSDGYDRGGLDAILALKGLFVLMLKHNLEFPRFYAVRRRTRAAYVPPARAPPCYIYIVGALTSGTLQGGCGQRTLVQGA